MIMLPIICYWSYSTFFYLLSQLNWTTVKLHTIPESGRKNKVTIKKVIFMVIIQHILQIIVSYLLAIFSREDGVEKPMEPIVVALLKIIVGVFMMDTWQVYCFNLVLGSSVDAS